MRRLNSGWSTLSLAAAAGMAGSVLAAPPAGDAARQIYQRLPAPVLVDDMASLELANKLGLSAAPQGGLRGVTCDPVNDATNCHPADLTLGANFSGMAAGAFRTMDNVTPTTSNPTQLCWIGRYANRVDPIANESFSIRIFNDVGGLPDLVNGLIYDEVFSIGGGGCSADWDGSGSVNSNDISAFLTSWLSDVQNGTTLADFDGSGGTNSNDISAFLTAWLAQIGQPCTGGNVLEMTCLDTCPGTTNPVAGGHWIFSAEQAGGFPINGNSCYWVEIANVGSNAAGTNWGWVGSNGGTDLMSLQAIDGAYTTFSRVAGDRSFCFNGGVSPFQGGCTLPPLPPICDNDNANGIPMNGGLTNGFRASSPGSNGGACWTPFQRAENFAFGSPQTVTNVCFGGFWLGQPDGCGTVGIAAPAQPNFDVIYYADVDGFPGLTPIADFTVGDPGVTFVWDGDDIASVTHPPVNFDADTCYYVSIGRVQIQQSAGQPTTPLWHWFLTFDGATPTADNWVYSTVANDPAGWDRFDIHTTSQPGNMWFLFDAGPTTLPVCEPPPCLPEEIPANDACANAIALAIPSTVVGDTSCATVDAEPDCIGTANSAPGVWYSVTGTGGVMTASACTNIAYDGQLSVFTGGCGALTCVTGGDDTCGQGGGHATVSWQSTAGVQYLILVHGWGGGVGTYQLDVSSN